ncbi:GNAT family N-acetyltransferase [Anaerobacillus isosaccharinicus]|uniref:GNAT family N-acetyltransferase n=1 Tax=Anaerobacillus isosaccharinicus TaxID=1532552 RepID=A0A1S2LIB2_9BACI|nr:GNAT family N-acetyltransferase [Anaerobacillus isosaccharinicus]MBA5586113.1 GNAT family N-acetyltransferase [Anaerobacillus isosaccharinicus]QOY35619.1 GNAT family N-acetyltransferase [Anaerobacillus isosaccharinicus]
MSWQLKTFDELTKNQLYTIIKERINIFVVEQNCPYPELDDLDQNSFHLFLQEEGEIRAYCRILPKGLKYEEVSIGRVIVKEKYRRSGIASLLMKNAIAFVEEELKETKIKIQAQDHLRHFYQSFGFTSISEVYLEDGIPHVDMVKC